MEKKVFEANDQHFIVHIEPMYSDNTKAFKGSIYFAQEYFNFHSGDTGIQYSDSCSSDKYHNELNPDCRKAFEFSFTWRGVWEGRIYFPNDDEFWSEDLRSFYDLWEQLKQFLKEKIKVANPDYKHFDE